MLLRLVQIVFGAFLISFGVALSITLFLILDPEVHPFSLFAPMPPPGLGSAAGAAFLPRGAGQIARTEPAAAAARIPDALAAWLDAN